jgi:hypothetical protein
MKNKLYAGLVFLLAMLITECTPDKEAMKKQAMKKQAIEKQIINQVDEVVAALDSGKKAEDFKKLATERKYYIFIMEKSGHLLVHPDLQVAGYAYKDMIKATADGLWVEYNHWGWKRNYIKKTKDGLFVGSGYYVAELEDAK